MFGRREVPITIHLHLIICQQRCKLHMILLLPLSEVENGFQELQDEMQLLAEHPGTPLRAHSLFNIMGGLITSCNCTETQLLFLAPFS